MVGIDLKSQFVSGTAGGLFFVLKSVGIHSVGLHSTNPGVGVLPGRVPSRWVLLKQQEAPIPRGTKSCKREFQPPG